MREKKERAEKLFDVCVLRLLKETLASSKLSAKTGTREKLIYCFDYCTVYPHFRPRGVSSSLAFSLFSAGACKLARIYTHTPDEKSILVLFGRFIDFFHKNLLSVIFMACLKNI